MSRKGKCPSKSGARSLWDKAIECRTPRWQAASRRPAYAKADYDGQHEEEDAD